MASENALSHARDSWPDEVEVVDSTVIPPDPRIMEAIGLNYALEAAVADLVDNSIDAGATNVLIRFIQRGPRLVSLCVVDNGKGMNEEELQQAMALGRRRDYESSDLGHFGLGLKAASLGQAKSLTVISRSRSSSSNGRRWMLENARDGFECDVVGQNFAAELLGRTWGSFSIRTGTLVLWDNVATFPRSQDAKTTDAFLTDTVPLLANHLGLVFHRLLDQGLVTIEIDVEDVVRVESGPPQSVPSIDPFGYVRSGRSDYPKILPVELGSLCVNLHCHIWTPRSQLPGFRVPRLGNHQGQGFYFYRNNRLLQAGGWNGIFQPEGQHQLARIAIDIENSSSGHFNMNPEKTQIRPSDDFVQALHSACKRGFDIKTYREEAARRLKASRTKPGTRRSVVPPGRGFAPSVRQAIEAELEFKVGVQPIDIRWHSLTSENLFQLDRDNHVILLNSRYRWALIGERSASLNDAPLLKALLFLLLNNLFEGEYLGVKEKDNVRLWDAILTAAVKVQAE